jgi:hypothetical protein
MAFGHADADAIYATIQKALKPMSIKTFRVDRIEHNDDIDKRIIAEIEAADFVLADLTYARPSVYFEAGYAQRVIPVIYIARRDHFRDKPEDPNGNLRVHFDLQMRNIIAWSSGPDRIFPKRLKARIRKVIAPLLLQKQEKEAQRHQISEFNGRSVQEKHKLLIGIAEKHFRKLRYEVTPLTSDENSRQFPFSPAPIPMQGGLAAIKQNRNEFRVIVVHTTPSITKTLCDIYSMLMNQFPLYSKQIESGNVPKRIREDLVICSFGSGGFTRLHKGIPYLRAGDTGHTLISDKPLSLYRYDGNIHVTRQTVFHVFETTSRLLALSEALSERFT